MCDDTGAKPLVSEEVVQENGWHCGGGCASHCDIGRAIELDPFFVCSSNFLDHPSAYWFNVLKWLP